MFLYLPVPQKGGRTAKYLGVSVPRWAPHLPPEMTCPKMPYQLALNSFWQADGLQMGAANLESSPVSQTLGNWGRSYQGSLLHRLGLHTALSKSALFPECRHSPQWVQTKAGREFQGSSIKHCLWLFVLILFQTRKEENCRDELKLGQRRRNIWLTFSLTICFLPHGTTQHCWLLCSQIGMEVRVRLIGSHSVVPQGWILDL